ncbi:MAG: superoxide dismutase, Ni [Candidatus Nealsonbacteria bacterium]|nr:superoxide dismutase, Ni [Candidatus Nealsonbacteria bacterium]
MIKTLKAKAHCDIPCSIYEPTPAKIAAKTVQRMVEQLEEFSAPKDMSDKKAVLHYFNYVSRRVAAKEEHSQICKKELSILWTDFFKQEHLDKFPNLHDVFWKALKLCSKNKQEVSLESAKELVRAVDEIAKIFYETKGDKDRYGAYQEITDKLY